MRLLITTGVIMLAIVALHPATTPAKGPGGGMKGGGSSGGGSMGSGQHWNSNSGGHNHDWDDHGRGGYGHGYGYPVYGWNYGYYPYTVHRPIVENPLPPTYVSGGPITIVNPPSGSAALSYTLNGFPYTIQPGQKQELTADRSWVIEFSRGPNLDTARYSLLPGLYTFGGTNHGWELYRTPLQVAPLTSAPTSLPAPSLPQPTSSGPGAPSN
jgi:hypothetical protein